MRHLFAEWHGGLFAAVLAWTLLLIAASMWQWLQDGGLYAGDGRTSQDLWQYMSWIRESGEHGLIANRFDLRDYGAVFLQPVFLVSGIAWKLGAPIQLAYMLWKPAVVAGLFGGVVLYARRFLPTTGQRRAGILLGLFMFTPVQALIEATNLGGGRAEEDVDRLQSDLFLGAHLAGSLPLALSVAAMPFFLVGCERIVSGAPRQRLLIAATAAAGALASWSHPWQGLTLLCVLGAAWLWARMDARYLRLAWPAVGAALPIAYYAVLSFTADAFQIVGDRHVDTSAAWVVLLAVAPFVAAALPGVRASVGDFGERMLVLWPLVALLLYFGLGAAHYSLHALNGLTIPLAILAVRGYARIRPAAPRLRAAVAAGGLLLLLGSVPVYTVRAVERAAENEFRNVESRDVDRAMAYLREVPGPGGVASVLQVGAVVPAMTGRPTWTGHQAWTPDWRRRSELMASAIFGHGDQQAARRAVLESGARFVIGVCGNDLRPLLGDRFIGVRRFGCIDVYELRPT